MNNMIKTKNMLKKAAAGGLIGLAVLTALFAATAGAMPSVPFLCRGGPHLPRICLFLSAVVCGIHCAAGEETNVLLKSLSGEAVLTILIIVQSVLRSDKMSFSTLAAAVCCTVFGGIAGAVLTAKKRGNR